MSVCSLPCHVGKEIFSKRTTFFVIIIFFNTFVCSSVNINSHDGIIPAISKHVIAQEALAGGGEGVGIEEAGGGG